MIKAEKATKNLSLTIKFLQNNARISLFHDVMPVLLDILSKYKGKPYGEKTREKIAKELEERHIRIPRENLAVVKRVIHTTADFEYAETLHFTENAVQKAIEALHNGATIITDTNMALAGVSKPGLKKLNGEALCFMADPAVAQSAKESGTTRAVAAMHKAAKELPRRSKTVCAPRSSSVCRSAL